MAPGAELAVAVSKELLATGGVQEVDEPVAENAVVLSIVERHVRDRAVVDGDLKAELRSRERNRPFRYLDPPHRHPALEKRLGVPAVADAGYQDVLGARSHEVVARETSRRGRLESPGQLHLGERCLPKLSHERLLLWWCEALRVRRRCVFRCIRSGVPGASDHSFR